MKRLSLIALALIAAFALASCNISLIFGGNANSTSTAVAVMSHVGYMGGISPGPYNGFPSSTASLLQYQNFSGSYYFSSATSSGMTQSAYTLSNQAVTYSGNTYYLSGTFNYSYISNSGTFTAYIYAPNGITISGPDYSATVTVDIAESFYVTYAQTFSGSATSYINGQYISSSPYFSL
ncbi:MAG TPA: hypothetical protein VMV44_04840 [Rectinemataceae bacterium]|nr:hypothetical protein [Rectinemataceae bacterium]